MRLIPALILLSAAPAQAACQPDSEIFACQIGSKTLEVCHEGDALVYRFGPHAAPELTLSEPLATLDYQPWSGFGRNRFYTVTSETTALPIRSGQVSTVVGPLGAGTAASLYGMATPTLSS
jgi:hypothetical protein